MHLLPIEDYTKVLTFHKEYIESLFCYHLEWNTQYRYLLIAYSPYAEFYAQVQVNAFTWSANEQLFEKDTSVRKYEYQNKFIAKCTIRFADQQHQYQRTTIEHNFELDCKYYFDVDPHSTARIEILDNQRQLLSMMNDAIFDFYKRAGIDGEDFMLGADRLSNRFQQALYRCNPPVQIIPFDIWFELLYCIQRIRFTIANMALYQPYLDNPIWHGHYFHNRFVYPSNSTLYDERYFIYCEFSYQSLYHFWDRIRDVLAEAVTTGLTQTAIDFVRVIDRIKLNPDYSLNPAFQWLDESKSTEYKLINEERKQTVHYERVTTKMKRQHLKGFSNLAEVETRQSWIDSRVDYFIGQSHQAVEGVRQLTLF